ncbi:MAG: hypothetical protein ACKJSG_19360, partial [Lentisphaeria bacterium]
DFDAQGTLRITVEPATRTCNRLPTIISNFSFQLAVRFYSRYFFAKTTSITGGVVRATVTLGPSAYFIHGFP